MRQLLKIALQAGIEYSDFWEMTVGEIVFIVDCYNEKANMEYKKDLAVNYALAQNIAVAVSCHFAGKQPPSLYETYPGLFKEQQPEEKEDKRWMLYKEQMIDFANRHNKKRGENKE